jgi:tripartite-type tricarboxylate transporter receptor subunit TctC
MKSVQDLVAYAKANPAKATYASSSPAFQLPTEQFKQGTGAPLVGDNRLRESASGTSWKASAPQ